MKVGFPGGPRLEWYDRNPQPIEQAYWAEDLAPHTITERFSYTVPTGKRFFLENARVKVVRTAAATAVDRIIAAVQARAIEIVEVDLHKNQVGDSDGENVGRSVIMLAGEVLRAVTYDDSTGGTADYRMMAHGIEFDA